MAKLDLDFGGVGALPEEGVYRLTIDKAIVKSNKAKDGKVVNLQMSLTDMPDEAFEGQKVFDSPSLKLAARWKIKEVLEAFTQKDWDEDGLEIEYDEETGEIEMLQNLTALGICYHDDYQGKMNLKVKTYLPDNGQVEIGASAS
jgi:hypothetical protein